MTIRTLLTCSLLALVACGSPTTSHKTKQYAQLYRSVDGHIYTRSRSHGAFLYWLYVPQDRSDAYSSNRVWARVPTPPALIKLDQLVEEEDGQPTEATIAASAVTVPVITEETTDADGAAFDDIGDGSFDSGGEAGGDGGDGG